MSSAPLVLGLLIAVGLPVGLLASRFGLPRVAAYVLVGVLFSPDILGTRLGLEFGAWVEPVAAAALGVVAYLIGGAITVRQLRHMGKMILGVTLGESLGAVLVVFLGIFAYVVAVGTTDKLQLPLLFAAIAATTAPAATVAVIHQYRAKGPVTSTLLAVVALDDALGIILFSILTVAAMETSLIQSLARALLEIGGALALGGITGSVLAAAGHRIGTIELMLPMLLGTIWLVTGMAEVLHVSPLLAAMALGFLERPTSLQMSQIFFFGANNPLLPRGKITGGRLLANAARGRCLRRRWRLAYRRIVTR